ncbi:hypothetical protein BGZ63DRAFT_423205 [Mariannaea sp. PMI_226]|nr:hypothetical protein BGZ63DRAFT_423205 [Mariannaea sp. PMI_226]
MSIVTSVSEPCNGTTTRTFHQGEADDDVYPVHLFDGAKFQYFIPTMFLRFNDVLDPAKIKTSLATVLDIGDWRKLGGRFRTPMGDCDTAETKSNGYGRATRLEIHVPKTYTDQRPAMQFACETQNCSVFEHSLGRHFPRSTNNGVELSPPLDEITGCGYASGFPKTMEDLVDKDVPQLAFKVILYNDATILAITFSHCTWDVSGIQGFLKSFELVMDGHEDEVPPMLGARDDVLSQLAAQHMNPERDLEPLGMPTKLASTQPACTTNQNLEHRVLRIPLDIFPKLQQYAAADNPSNEDVSSLCQSDELLIAIILQQIARAQPVPQPLKLVHIFNSRVLIPQLAESNGVYCQNLVLWSPQTVCHEVAAGSILTTIQEQREHFAKFVIPEHIKKHISSVLAEVRSSGTITAVADTNGEDSVIVNNVACFSNCIEVNLSAAVVRQGDVSACRRNGLGTVDLVFTKLAAPLGINTIITYGSYNGTACWMIGELSEPAWDMIYKLFKTLEFEFED